MSTKSNNGYVEFAITPEEMTPEGIMELLEEAKTTEKIKEFQKIIINRITINTIYLWNGKGERQSWDDAINK